MTKQGIGLRMGSGITPFQTDRQLIEFARTFLKGRIRDFRKDVAICLTANEKRSHAYFPALITCITFLDFLSGLYSGKVKGHGLKELCDYAKDFMDNAKYSNLKLAILYEVLRHKIAHLGHPYYVFDTSTNRKIPGPKRLVTWTICASRLNAPIELIPFAELQSLHHSPPWKVCYDHRIKISLALFEVDVVKSVRGNTGYLSKLISERQTRERFAHVIKEIYPPCQDTSG